MEAILILMVTTVLVAGCRSTRAFMVAGISVMVALMVVGVVICMDVHVPFAQVALALS